MSRPTAKAENEDPQITALTKRLKLEELQTTIAELRARRAEANARFAEANERVAKLAESPVKKPG